MRKICSIFFLGFLCAAIQAQTQVGVVRTAGRANHSGRTLSDVIIRVDGEHNAVISREDGSFSIRFNGIREGDMYRISSVRKPNYEILDKGFIGRSLAFSSKVPITIVLLDKSEMEQEKRTMEERFEKAYATNYERRVQEIERQYKNQIISLEQKIAALEESDQLYEKIHAQMNEMVDHYLRTDYDVLDSLDRQINALIEDGRFDQARELILSKGNVEERVEALLNLQQQVEGNEKAIAKLQRKQAQLVAQANANQENLLKDLMNLYHIARADLQIDTAQVLLDHMLAIAPTDLDVLLEAASFQILTRKSMMAGLRYSQRFLACAKAQYSDSSTFVLRGYNMVAAAYGTCYNLDSALMTYQELIPQLEKVKDDTAFAGWAESIYKRVARIYEDRKAYDTALYYYDKAWGEMRRHPSPDSPNKEAYMAYRYAWLYRSMSDYNQAFEFNRQAIEAYTHLNDSQMIAESYRQRAYIHEDVDSLDDALKALHMGLHYIDTINNPQVGVLCNIYSNMTDIFVKKQQYDSALVYANAVLEAELRRYNSHYIGYIFNRFSRADVYAAMHRYEESLADYDAGIADLLTYYADAPSNIAFGYRDRAGVYEQMGEIDKAIADYETAIEYFRKDSSSPIWRITNLENQIQHLKNP